MAWYSLGCVYTELKDDPRAIDAYLKARDLFPDTLCRYYALTEQNLGQHYLSQHMLDAAEQVLRHYHDLSVLRGDSTDVGFSHFFIGQSYLHRLDYVHAAPYYDSVLANPHSMEGIRNRCLLDQAKLAIYHTHDYERGFQLIDRYRKAFHDDSYLQIVPGIRGDLFSAVGQNDSAYACYTLSVQHAQNLAVLCNGYNHLAELSARLGRAEESIKYFKLQCQYRDSIYHLRRTDEIAQIEQRHAAEVHELKEREERTRLVILLSAAVMFVFILVLFYLKSYKYRQEKKINALRSELSRTSMALMALQGETEPTATAVETREGNTPELLAHLLALGRQLYASRHTGDPEQVVTTTDSHAVNSLRQQYLAALDESFSEFFSSLKALVPELNKQEMIYIVSKSMGISDKALRILQLTEESAFRMRRKRIREKLSADLLAVLLPPVNTSK